MISCFVNYGLLYIALGALGVFEGIRLIKTTGIAYGPGQYLAIISALILIVGIFYYIEEFRKARKGGTASSAAAGNAAAAEAEEEVTPAELPKGVAPCFSLSFNIGGREIRIGPAILAFILFTLYAVLTKWIGYLASTVLFVVSAMLLFGERIWWKLAVFGVVVGLTFWAVFIRFAGIPL